MIVALPPQVFFTPIHLNILIKEGDLDYTLKFIVGERNGFNRLGDLSVESAMGIDGNKGGNRALAGPGDVAPGQFSKEPETNNWETRAEFQFQRDWTSEKGGTSKKNGRRAVEIWVRLQGAVVGWFLAGQQPALFHLNCSERPEEPSHKGEILSLVWARSKADLSISLKHLHAGEGN